jgi:benzoyl-CoA reductase/2-hydroxyglutaryl-CoA dehydratase subunit BcrC/BadD/HgdB
MNKEKENPKEIEITFPEKIGETIKEVLEKMTEKKVKAEDTAKAYQESEKESKALIESIVLMGSDLKSIEDHEVNIDLLSNKILLTKKEK